MLTPEQLTTLRIQIGHHKGVSNVVAISVERMESLFQMIDALAAKITELEQQRDHLLAACRRAVLALAAASEKDAAFRSDYEAMSDAIRKATASASQTADSEPQTGLYRNSEAQECPCNACHKDKLAANPPADRMASLMALTSRGIVLCPTCGNKRCPHANDHRHACTGSNLPGQPGSAHPNNETRYPLDGVESDGGEL
jgi:hypothetical protein